MDEKLIRFLFSEEILRFRRLFYHRIKGSRPRLLLEEIDRYMERLRDREPELYSTYSDATYIRLTGIRHEKEAPVTPAQATSVPLK